MFDEETSLFRGERETIR